MSEKFKKLTAQVVIACSLVGLLIALAPNLNDHHDRIALFLNNTTTKHDSSIDIFSPWDDMTFRNLAIFTTVRYEKTNELVSVGFMNKVFVIGQDWVEECKGPQPEDKILVYEFTQNSPMIEI